MISEAKKSAISKLQVSPKIKTAKKTTCSTSKKENKNGRK